MFESQSYELLDFGDGRKLERFGGVVVDRPCPTAANEFDTNDAIDRLNAWKSELRFEGRTGHGKWAGSKVVDENWQSVFEYSVAESNPKKICFELRTTESGQVGIFPEQAPNWNWITQKCASRIARNQRPAKVLNLFAYTGGSTLAAAAGGAEVTHVDSAKSVVNWARRNAELSNLGEASIRWIVEDAPKFVARELKRGNRYDGIILDPPSYGHGPKREEWKLSRDLVDLVSDCKQLLSETPVCFLLSCHTPGFEAPELSSLVSTCLFGSCGAGVRTRSLTLEAYDGRRLPSGFAAYWP